MSETPQPVLFPRRSSPVLADNFFSPSPNANVNEELQVSLGSSSHPLDLRSPFPLKLKEFRAFMEYKDLDQPQVQDRRKHPDSTCPRVFLAASIHRPAVEKLPSIPKCYPSEKFATDRKALHVRNAGLRPLQNCKSVPRLRVACGMSPRAETQTHKKTIRRASIMDLWNAKCGEKCAGRHIEEEKGTAKPKSKEPKDLRYHHKYSMESLLRHRVAEPRMLNPFADCHSPLRVYEKAEYLSHLPPNPAFNVTELESRIDKLCHVKKGL